MLTKIYHKPVFVSFLAAVVSEFIDESMSSPGYVNMLCVLKRMVNILIGVHGHMLNHVVMQKEIEQEAV